jgi:2-polyprenyl-3-methyl-5-hydroxy-6-metoxy-1,4-benzoquinol methylase
MWETDLIVFGEQVEVEILSVDDIAYLRGLPAKLPDVEWVWGEMDKVWRSLDLNNRLPLSDQNISDFYRHPVWLMNSIFSRLDITSRNHRSAIAKYIAGKEVFEVADYGGGYGELALAIGATSPESKVTIIEPYLSSYAQSALRALGGVEFSPTLDRQYDVIVAQDVLEHVEDPVMLAREIIHAVKPGGLVIFANCFWPVIECHLPSTFYLRYTFPWIMRSMGLSYVGVVDGANHAQVYMINGRPIHPRSRWFDRISKLLGPIINRVFIFLGKLRH